MRKSIYWSAKNKKKEEPKLEVQVEQEHDHTDMIYLANQDAMGSMIGVEQEENKIYVYSAITDKETLELNKLIKRLDKEMQVVGLTFNIPPPPIELHIQSDGGILMSGFSSYDCIKSCKSPVHTYIDGRAASAATLLFLAGTKRFVYENSYMLVHQLSGTVIQGTHQEFKDELKNQEKMMHNLKKIYLESSNLKEEELVELLKHDLWLTSEEVIKYGFADKIV